MENDVQSNTGTPIKTVQTEVGGLNRKENNTSIKDYFPGGVKDEDSVSMDPKFDRLSLGELKEPRLLDDKVLDLHRNLSRSKFIAYMKEVLTLCSERDSEALQQ